MRLVFMGTPRFAVPPLQALAKAGHNIAGVMTRIDKPAGRGRTIAQPAVKVTALEMGLNVFQPKHLRDPDTIESLRRLAPEVIVVAAYGQILPKEILRLPKYGCINIHASLLPLYRGAAPINWAIIHGDARTGNTIMQMEEGMDTGAILLQEAIPIDPKDTAGTLTEKLSALGAKLITDALPLIEAGKLTPEPQDRSKATLAPLLKKEDGLINWKLSAPEIHNLVRGLTPWPSAYTFLDETMVKILETETLQGRGESGRILEGMQGNLYVGTGSGLLRIIRVQPAGKKPMDAADFLRGHREIEGKQFASEQRTHDTKG
jgi:methionyl-tRNA formyltransferase